MELNNNNNDIIIEIKGINENDEIQKLKMGKLMIMKKKMKLTMNKMLLMIIKKM